MSLSSIANAADAAAPAMSTGTGLMSLFPMILIFVIFYFFLIRPQVKRQRALEGMINDLKKGDQVVAAGGVFGTIIRIEDNVLFLEIAENIKIKALKSSVTEVIKNGKQEEKSSTAEKETKSVSESKTVAKKTTAKKPSSKK